MIYVHTYEIGKFGPSGRRKVQIIHDTKETALAQQAVLGGSVQGFVAVEDYLSEREHMRDVLTSEVSEIIDDFSTIAPGSAGSFEAGSPEWDCKKLRAINAINKIIDGDF